MSLKTRPFDFYVTKTDTCWVWKSRFGGRPRKYAEYRVNGKRVMAHRYSWERVNGPIPTDMILHHKCKNKLCVNPDHLELTTYEDHVDAPGVINKNKTHCKRGHEFTKENILWNGKFGRRRCKTCCNEYNRRHR